MLPAVATEVNAVLIDGPYLTRKRWLFHSLLQSWTNEPVIASTRHIDDRVRRIHEQATATEPASAAICATCLYRRALPRVAGRSGGLPP